MFPLSISEGNVLLSRFQTHLKILGSYRNKIVKYFNVQRVKFGVHILYLLSVGAIAISYQLAFVTNQNLQHFHSLLYCLLIHFVL